MVRALLPAAALMLVLAACTEPPLQGAASTTPAELTLPAPAPASAAPAALATPASATPAARPMPASAAVVHISTNAQGEPAFKIDAADATCSSNADCDLTMTECACDCGSPVNRARSQKYVDARERMCQNYHGMMCKMACDDTVICDKGICRIKK